MAMSLLISIAEQLLPKLASFASQEVELVYGVKDDARKLEEILSTIKAVLLDAEMKQETGHARKSSLQRLKEVVFDADDLFEDIATENLRRKAEGGANMMRKVSDFFSSSNQIAFRFKVGHRIKDIRGRLDEITKDVSIIRFVSNEARADTQVKYSWRETDSFILESEMIGREEDKKEVIKLLLSLGNEESVSVVAVTGFGGLGKTALAQLVYQDESVRNFFGLRIWVCVSEEFDVQMLLKKILKCVTNGEVGDLDLDQLQSRVQEKLRGMRYLLVLDDVWNENREKWNNLRKYLLRGIQGSKILVTTRSKKVCLAMDVVDSSLYELKGLTESQSWDLFEKLAFRKGQDQSYQDLVGVGKKIVKRCKGVPLAIRTLGSMMRLKNSKDEWLSVLNNEMWRLFESGDNDIGPVLKLSYAHLPIYLRQCFVSCSMFPKDYEFYDKEELIKIWIAQGYIQCSSESESESLEEIGDHYFNELLFRSLFQKYKWYYKMHDLIHDLAQSIAGDSCIAVVNNDKQNIPERIHHMYCESSLLPPKLLTRKNNGLRTLFFKEVYNSADVLDAIASNCMRLRVLRSPRNYVTSKLSKSIGKLKHLRCLDISDSDRIESLPNSICSLYNLQTLILSKCWGLRELPRDVRKLISLRHLMIDGCLSLKGMPLGLGKLTSLRTLSNFIVAWDKGGATLNELNSLNQLRGYLRIEGLGNVKNAELESNQVNLKEKKHLHKLCLDWYRLYTEFLWGYRTRPCFISEHRESGNSELLLDNLHPPPNLKHLDVRNYGGVRFSSWLSSLTNLVQLDITYCPNSKHLPSLDQLPYLELLRLYGFEVLEYISCEPFSPSSAPFFSSLKELYFKNCPRLMGWWSKAVERPQFPCLSRLIIDGCPNLTLMPTFPYLDVELMLMGANLTPLHETMKVKMMMSTEVMMAASSSSSSDSVTAPLSKLKSLYLTSIEDLCALPDWISNLTSLERLTIEKCPKLTSLSKAMQQLTSLKMLNIWACPHLSERYGNDMAADWPTIAHIPDIIINGPFIQRNGCYLSEQGEEGNSSDSIEMENLDLEASQKG